MPPRRNIPESTIQKALDEFNTGIHPSLSAAAAAHHIPRSTLQDRASGRQSHADSCSGQQRLTPLQEKELVEWIVEEHELGRAPTCARTRVMAERFLRAAGDTAPLGANWLQKFRARHPRVRAIINSKPEGRRVSRPSQDAINAFMLDFAKVARQMHSLQERIHQSVYNKQRPSEQAAEAGLSWEEVEGHTPWSAENGGDSNCPPNIPSTEPPPFASLAS